ncbi:hypothetical protein [Bdellovibrio sp. HCB209]|uniref:hypothetical protein n=1 Tax=Bdellovibrio sp. HCB209 TaxID=3394354 RepID=UPI0039B3BD0D
MSSFKVLQSFIAAVLLLGSLSVAKAGPSNKDAFERIEGGFVDIKEGAYIDGSVGHKGIQPDYIMDLKSEPLQAIMKKSESIGALQIDEWDKIGMVLEVVRQDVFKYQHYYNPYYRRLLKKYRVAGEDIPLSEYVSCQAGVCREHAMVLHFALKAAGVPNHFVYADVARVYNYYLYNEDHAFTVIRKNGVDWVVDAYNDLFNGYRLDELMSKNGISSEGERAPFAVPSKDNRFIRKIHNFPVVYNPKGLSCRSVFQ